MMLGVFVGSGVDRVVVAGVGVRDNGHRVVDQFRVQGLQPVDARVTAEPSHLFAGESLGFLCDVAKASFTSQMPSSRSMIC